MLNFSTMNSTSKREWFELDFLMKCFAKEWFASIDVFLCPPFYITSKVWISYEKIRECRYIFHYVRV